MKNAYLPVGKDGRMPYNLDQSKPDDDRIEREIDTDQRYRKTDSLFEPFQEDAAEQGN